MSRVSVEIGSPWPFAPRARGRPLLYSGRRTFITRAARRFTRLGGSLRDVATARRVPLDADHERDIDGDSDVQRKLAQLIHECPMGISQSGRRDEAGPRRPTGPLEHATALTASAPDRGRTLVCRRGKGAPFGA